MKNTKTIIDEYRTGDFENRLNLFLECPLLRNEFIQIEQEEALVQSAHASEPASNQAQGEKSIFYPCKRWLKRCTSSIG